MSYGIPYMGSKNKIVKFVLDILPPAEHFYDLFAGGCAITHAAIVSGKFKEFFINDIDPAPLNLFIDAVKGKYNNENKWITREEFFKRNDPYITYCWNFGSKARKSYLYSEEREKYKEAFFYAVVHKDWNKFKNLFPNLYKEIEPKLKHVHNIEQRYHLFIHLFQNEKKRKNPDFANRSDDLSWQLDNCTRLFRLQRLGRLHSLIGNDKVHVYNGNYDDVKILPNSTVYCDPPYRETTGYSSSFDFDRFDNWLRTREFPVYISEYSMPDDFIVIGEKKRMCSLATGKYQKAVIEKVFIHEKWKDIIKKKIVAKNFF